MRSKGEQQAFKVTDYGQWHDIALNLAELKILHALHLDSSRLKDATGKPLKQWP